MKKYIFFDLYGTIIHIRTDEHSLYPYQNVSKWLEEKNIKISPERLKDDFFRICKEHAERMKKELPEIKIDYVLWDMLKEFKPSDELVKALALHFRKATTKEIYPIPQAIEVLKKLSKGFKLAIVSNAQRMFTEEEIKQFKVDTYFEHIFISSDRGVRKPSKEFFEYALKKMKAKAKETVFVGNNILTDIQVPKKMGFTTVLITREYDPDEDIKAVPDYAIGDIKELPKIVKNV